MIARFSVLLAAALLLAGCYLPLDFQADINIDDVRNPHDIKGDQSLAWLKVNRDVGDDVIAGIADAVDADIAVYTEL